MLRFAMHIDDQRARAVSQGDDVVVRQQAARLRNHKGNAAHRTGLLVGLGKLLGSLPWPSGGPVSPALCRRLLPLPPGSSACGAAVVCPGVLFAEVQFLGLAASRIWNVAGRSHCWHFMAFDSQPTDSNARGNGSQRTRNSNVARREYCLLVTTLRPEPAAGKLGL